MDGQMDRTGEQRAGGIDGLMTEETAILIVTGTLQVTEADWPQGHLGSAFWWG